MLNSGFTFKDLKLNSETYRSLVLAVQVFFVGGISVSNSFIHSYLELSMV